MVRIPALNQQGRVYMPDVQASRSAALRTATLSVMTVLLEQEPSMRLTLVHDVCRLCFSTHVPLDLSTSLWSTQLLAHLPAAFASRQSQAQPAHLFVLTCSITEVAHRAIAVHPGHASFGHA